MSGQEWRLQAACRGVDQRLPFGMSTVAQQFIREFCRHCPVTRECLELAVEVDGPGVYGGMTRRERVVKGLVAPVREMRPRCGSVGGYQSHVRRGEEPCRSCVLGKREYYTLRRRAGR